MSKRDAASALVKQKRALSDLALFGGEPAFSTPLHVGLPNFGDVSALRQRIDEILSSRRFTNDGPFVHELEERVVGVTGAGHAIATCNATTGLQLLARALELNGEIVMPSFTFIATPHAFAWLGLEPKFCDIEERTHTIDPVSLEGAVGKSCSAIVGVHTWGIPCDVPALETLGSRLGLPVIFDAAPAFGCTYGDRPLGSFGTAEVFSLHATKIVNSFEGGVITTNDRELALRLRQLRDFGFTGYDRVGGIGTNAKMSELHAAAGLTTIDALPAILAENLRCYQQYRAALGSMAGLRLLDPSCRGRSNHQYVVLELDEARTLLSRDDLVRTLHAEGVIARRYFTPGCHRSAPYAEREVGRRLPVTERVSARVIVLPTGPSVTESAIFELVNLLRLVLTQAADFKAKLARLPADSDGG